MQNAHPCPIMSTTTAAEDDSTRQILGSSEKAATTAVNTRVLNAAGGRTPHTHIHKKKRKERSRARMYVWWTNTRNKKVMGDTDNRGNSPLELFNKTCDTNK